MKEREYICSKCKQKIKKGDMYIVGTDKSRKKPIMTSNPYYNFLILTLHKHCK